MQPTTATLSKYPPDDFERLEIFLDEMFAAWDMVLSGETSLSDFERKFGVYWATRMAEIEKNVNKQP